MNVTLYQQNVELERPVRASGQDHRQRTRLFLRVEDEGVAGFGEVAPQPFALNGDPGLGEVLEVLDATVALVGAIARREGALPPWARMGRLSNASPARNVACALVEMALLDRELRVTSTLIEELWTPLFKTPSQVTVSLLDAETDWLTEGATRVRVKSAPGDVSSRALERLRALRVPVIIDFNCSATSDEDVLEQVTVIGRVATIDAVEQPFGVGNLVDHARLATRLDVPLSLDESVRSLRDLTHIANYEAAAMICVKPARVGGLSSARALIARASELGLRTYLGGFFESPYARGVHRGLANSCVSEPSDLDNVAVGLGDEGTEISSVSSSFGFEPSARVLASAERRPISSEIQP